VAERRLDAAVIHVDGRPLVAELYPRLRSARIEESVLLPDTFVLRFEDAHFELFDDGPFTLGVPVQIAFRAEADPIVVTEGDVTAIGVEPGPSGRHELVVSGLDRSHRLAQCLRHRSFLNMSDAAIARQIAGEYGLTARVDSTPGSHDYVLQAGLSDLTFLRERAARIGFDVWITGPELHFRPRPDAEGTPPALRWGENLLSFRTRFSAAERCDEVVVHGWDDVGKRTVTGRASASDADDGADCPAADDAARAARQAFGRNVRETGLIGVEDQQEADALAKSLLLRASGSGATLKAEVSGDPRLGAGVTVQVAGVGTRLAGRYRLTAVEHVYASGQPYVTRITCGSKDPAGLVDLLRGDPGAAFGDLGGGYGARLLPAQVTNNDDPEGLGRVKVRFPTLSAQDESQWARVAAPGAGAARGMQWIPEVGDEVLVGFEFSDVHRPVVMGGMWSRTDAPPEKSPVSGGTTTVRVLASRTGHRVRFTDDPQGEVQVAMGDASSALTLTRDRSTLAAEQALDVTGTQIKITATQKLVLSAPQVEISATGPVTVSGKPIKLN
jgi:phage protein D/phage baseplate assembly protein gpV